MNLVDLFSQICTEAENSFEAQILSSPDEFQSDQFKKFILKRLSSLDEAYKKRLEQEFFGLGPIEILIADSSVTEILVNSFDSIWFEQNGKLHRHDDQFLSAISFYNTVERLGQLAGKHLSLERPFLEGHFNGMRLSIIGPQLTGAQAIVSIRKHPTSPWSLRKLVTADWCSNEQMNLLQSIVQSGSNFLVIGETGSGKTSVINALLQETRTNERAVIIEDSSEVYLPNQASIKLLTRDSSEAQAMAIDQQALLKRALRLRPDRLVMGEIRGEESKDFLMLLATGHKGCFATLHAKNPSEALIRLEMLIQLGAPQWNLQAIRRLIFLSLQFILVVEKSTSGKRRLKGIYKLSSLEDSGITLDSTESFEPLANFSENV
jgi:pilus assembly protein CpaF